jgi:hypothetical protein
MPDLLERLTAALADRYAVESEIGRGGMAAVFLAEDLKHRRKVDGPLLLKTARYTNRDYDAAMDTPEAGESRFEADSYTGEIMDRRPLGRLLSNFSLRLIAQATVLCVLVIGGPFALKAQDFPADDPVIHRMWEVGMERSKTETLAQVLMDSIGPRWAGTPNLTAAQEWLLQVYASWGVSAHREQYGTRLGWEQGIFHVDLIAPRVQSLEAKMWVYSPSTNGPIEGDVVALPLVTPLDPDVDPSRWLPMVEGKWVLVFPPEPTCRPIQDLEVSRPETAERLKKLREENRSWRSRIAGGGAMEPVLDRAGALGIIGSFWSGGWGTFKVFDAGRNLGIPFVGLSCEDYGLVYRLAQNDQHPRLRIETEAERGGQVPQFNVIAELRGTELPDEYVVLSAHLDSWHSATGATDNGTGTIAMLEAMRILKETYPNPRRTILVGHWGGEETSFAGSRAFRENHPDVVEGLQALFNQDAGTTRTGLIEGQGFLYAEEHIGRWISRVPREISEHIRLVFPGPQAFRGTDHISFLCVGAPAFDLQSPAAVDDGYDLYTHHSNRDTYDKILFDDLRATATLVAMLAYAASEDPERFPRDRAELPLDPSTGAPREWIACR